MWRILAYSWIQWCQMRTTGIVYCIIMARIVKLNLWNISKFSNKLHQLATYYSQVMCLSHNGKILSDTPWLLGDEYPTRLFYKFLVTTISYWTNSIYRVENEKKLTESKSNHWKKRKWQSVLCTSDQQRIVFYQHQFRWNFAHLFIMVRHNFSQNFSCYIRLASFYVLWARMTANFARFRK